MRGNKIELGDIINVEIENGNYVRGYYNKSGSCDKGCCVVAEFFIVPEDFNKPDRGPIPNPILAHQHEESIIPPEPLEWEIEEHGAITSDGLWRVIPNVGRLAKQFTIESRARDTEPWSWHYRESHDTIVEAQAWVDVLRGIDRRSIRMVLSTDREMPR